MPHKYFTVEGIATYVHHRGPTTLPDVPPDTGAGEAVLCLHGAGGNGGVFRALLDSLANAHSPLAFDQPGHGRSGALDSLGSIQKMADFTRAVIEKLNLRDPVLLGHEMGAAIALQYALRYPSETRALILCSPGARLDTSEETLELHRRVTEGKESRPLERERFAPSAAPERMGPAFMEDIKTDPRARFGDLIACREWEPDAGELNALDLPCLLIQGDAEASSAKSELIDTALAGAKRVTLKETGTMAPLERPEEVAKEVGDFLTELPS